MLILINITVEMKTIRGIYADANASVIMLEL